MTAPKFLTDDEEEQAAKSPSPGERSADLHSLPQALMTILKTSTRPTYAILPLLITAAVLILLAITSTKVLNDWPSTAPSVTLSGNSYRQNTSTLFFDPMSFSHLPSRCYDAELTSEFLSHRNWTWYLSPHDVESTVSQAEVLTGRYPELYVSMEYHVLHCTYMWKKLHRAVSRGGPIDGYIGRYEHTEHCAMMIEEAMGLASSGDRFVAVNTVITAKWPTCQ